MEAALHVKDILAPERDKYDKIWEQPDYLNVSPGWDSVERFMSVLQPSMLTSPPPTLIDIGCGTGIAGMEFEKRGFNVTYLDIVDKQLCKDINRKHFIKSPVWGDWRNNRPVHGWDFGFSTDILEHLPMEYTLLAIDRIIRNCRISWLQIAFLPDTHGDAIKEPLHLTVMPYGWWLDRIATLGKITDARDLCGRGVFCVEGK